MTSAFQSVSGAGAPPSTAWLRMFDTPSRVTTYVIARPSGDHLNAGEPGGTSVANCLITRPSSAASSVSLAGPGASFGIKQAIHFPSGDTAGRSAAPPVSCTGGPRSAGMRHKSDFAAQMIDRPSGENAGDETPSIAARRRALLPSAFIRHR